MNNYPEWWNQSITIFNKYEEPDTRKISWYKTSIDGCFWKFVGDRVIIGETTIETSSTLCRIPINPLFKEKYLWDELSEEEKSQYFTIGPGDIVIKGYVTDDIDEYTSGSRSSDILNKYHKLQGCMLIESISVNTGGNRAYEHYLIKGV